MTSKLKNNFGKHLADKLLSASVWLFVLCFGIGFLSVASRAEDVTLSEYAIPSEYSGYIIYETIDKYGNKTRVKQAVRYNIKALENYKSNQPYYNTSYDNDDNYSYRSYKIEIKPEKIASKTELQNLEENKKINSAAYYPLYLD